MITSLEAMVEDFDSDAAAASGRMRFAFRQRVQDAYEVGAAVAFGLMGLGNELAAKRRARAIENRTRWGLRGCVMGDR